ncbi:uncharacterized protein LOC124147309 [Haliotis rufescens]|uniref:uncharacterized protein LOC124147309 n=1 Tax=Haliotis rufescens TaxID=6454 RepID=UPI00201ECB4D|nr:uncharacterized protein LOC124147309 [Haliotis rufescens]
MLGYITRSKLVAMLWLACVITTVLYIASSRNKPMKQNTMVLVDTHKKEHRDGSPQSGEQDKVRTISGTSEHVLLVLFSTWINKKGKEHVQRSVLGTWRTWLTHIKPVLLTDDPGARLNAEKSGWQVRGVGETGCGNTSMPTLRGMFNDIIAQYKGTADLFGFANGDLVFDDGLLTTMQALVKQERDVLRSRPVMVLGKRTNVDMKGNVTVTDVSQVKGHASRGRYPGEGSSDFFFTNHLFPWDRVPEIVIGRVGFGMWIVAYARANNVTLYDVTKTVTAIHMTTKEGIFESGKSANAWCNHKLVNANHMPPKNYACGWINCARRRSMYSADGSVTFTDVKNSTLMKGCHLCGYN